MPEISRFFGIIIAIYFNDHAPPHFHAKYGEHKAKVDIMTGEITDGSLPRRALDLVNEWRLLHQAELLDAWTNILGHRPFNKIEPLE